MDEETLWQDAALMADRPLAEGSADAAHQSEGTDYDAPAPGPDEYDELETGIASIFAELQAGSDAAADDDAVAIPDFRSAEVHTYQLLGELDRLWHRPAP